MTDFSVPQRMSIGAFFIYFLKYMRNFLDILVAGLVLVIIKTDGQFVEILQRIAITIAVFIGASLVLAFLSFIQIKFHVEDGNIIYRHSLITRATTTIPLNRIHTLRTRQGLFYRLFNLRGVLFDTLASRMEEIELILSESDWQSLINRIEQKEKPRPADPEAPPVYNPSQTRLFSNRDLLADALCQNHLRGMLMLAGFAIIIFDNLYDLPDHILDRITGYLESQLDHFGVSVASIALVMACTYLVSLVLWLGKVVFRYYDLSLTYDSKMLTFSHGLFSRMTSRFARDKICTLRVKRNVFEKRFGLCTLAMMQALNSSARKAEDNLRIYGRECADFFLGWWLGEEYASETDTAIARSGTGVMMLSLFTDLVISSVAAAVLWYNGLYWWILIPAIYLLTGIPKGIMKMRHSHIALRQSYLIVGTGNFAETTNYLKYGNVEVLRLTRTPITRFTGRVSLTLSTTGSTFVVRSLREEQAMQIYEQILAKSDTHKSRAKH